MIDEKGRSHQYRWKNDVPLNGKKDGAGGKLKTNVLIPLKTKDITLSIITDTVKRI
jgi:hypothetical protein